MEGGPCQGGGGGGAIKRAHEVEWGLDGLGRLLNAHHGDGVAGKEHRIDRSVAHLRGHGVVHHGVLSGRHRVLDGVPGVGPGCAAIQVIRSAAASDGVRAGFDGRHQICLGKRAGVEDAFVTVDRVRGVQQFRHAAVEVVDVAPRDGGDFRLGVKHGTEALCLVPGHLVHVGVGRGGWRERQQGRSQEQQDEP